MSSATPRRSTRIAGGVPATKSQTTYTEPSPPIRPKMAARRSPYLPTTVEAILIAIYPTILVLGSLYSFVDPATRASPYLAAHQSHDPNNAPSYFARKDNLFNVIFVKRGWFWVTVSYFAFLTTNPSLGPRFVVTPKRIRGAIRWSLVTIWWIFVTQWFFGPAIIDRGFRLTGGQCELVQEAEEGNIDIGGTRQFVTSIACKAVGGKWRGGHDISGHVFLLVLGSMFLFEEVLHVALRTSKVTEERTIMMTDGAVKNAEVEASNDTAVELGVNWDLGMKMVLAVGGLSLWMLLMTAAYFHTWFEKFTGLLVAFSGIIVVYFLPRMVPSLRAAIGMPGL